jgi:uncharacterized protein (DUF433 family)
MLALVHSSAEGEFAEAKAPKPKSAGMNGTRRHARQPPQAKFPSFNIPHPGNDAGQRSLAKAKGLAENAVMNLPEVNELLPLDAAAPPLCVVEGGAVRIGKGRITLDLVVEEYESGMTPEDMVRAYNTLVLADVYAAIAYYLTHRDAVREYMKRREGEAAALRAEIEATQPRISLEELLARRAAKENANAATGG